MQLPHNKGLLQNARALRKNMTKEERKLWYEFLRNCPGHFRRQQIIGPYIADFYSHAAKLVVELDGSQHYEQPGIENDHIRDEYFRSLGLGIRRYSNAEINQHFTGVCEDILNCLKAPE